MQATAATAAAPIALQGPALAVAGLPAGTSHAELHDLAAQFCNVDRVIAVSAAGAAVAALVLLQPPELEDGGDAAAAVAAASAAELLDCYPLGGGLLEVQVCDNPRQWLLQQLGLQLQPPGSSSGDDVLHEQQQQQQQHAGGPATPDLKGAAVSEAAIGEGAAAAAYGGQEEEFNFPAPDEEDAACSDAWRHVARSGRSSAASSDHGSIGISSPEAGGASPGQRPGAGLVIHNVPPGLPAQSIGDFFCQFGPLEECLRPVGAWYVLLHFRTVEAAEAAMVAVHRRTVPELNPGAPVTAELRTGQCRQRARRLLELRRGGEWLVGSGGTPAPPQGSGCSLVVKNLALGVRTSHLLAAFEQSGALRECTKRPGARFAFVTFYTPDAAAAAIKALHGKPHPLLNPDHPLWLEHRQQAGGGGGRGGRR